MEACELLGGGGQNSPTNVRNYGGMRELLIQLASVRRIGRAWSVWAEDERCGIITKKMVEKP